MNCHVNICLIGQQNNLPWKRPREVIWYNLLLKAQRFKVKSDCSGPCSVNFQENLPQPPLAAWFDAYPLWKLLFPCKFWGGKFWLGYLLPSLLSQSMCKKSLAVSSLQSLSGRGQLGPSRLFFFSWSNPTPHTGSPHNMLLFRAPLQLVYIYFSVQKPKTGHAIPDVVSPVNKINHLLQLLALLLLT